MDNIPKSVAIGFCILSHNDSAQLLALVNTLNRVYDFPAIVCHHDVSQSMLDQELFPANVRFAAPSLKTGWGRFSVVEAGVLAIRELFQTSSVDWFVLLSASDYPIAKSDKLISLLEDTEFDAFIDARPLFIQSGRAATAVGNSNPSVKHFATPGNVRIKKSFYLSPEIWIPIIRFSPRLRVGRYTIRLPWISSALKRSGINIFYGDHWFMANKKAARVLYSDSRERSFLMRFLRRRAQADECYYQTMLMNSPDLTVSINNHRFSEWNGGGAHPMMLSSSQLDSMKSSEAFFARKFDTSSDVLPLIDSFILYG